MFLGNVSQWKIVAALSLLTLIGCGGDVGYDLSGKVTFDGNPIPEGMIYFSPDSSKGNKGSTGYAKIKNGAYDTASEGGMKRLAGPVIVKIDGFDPSAKGSQTPGDTSGEVTIKSLFPTYQTTADLTSGTVTQDFNVPAEAANRQDAPENAPVVP